MEVDETRPNMYPNRTRHGSQLTVPQIETVNPQSVGSGAVDVHPDRVGLVRGADLSVDASCSRRTSEPDSNCTGNSPLYSASSQGGPQKSFGARVHRDEEDQRRNDHIDYENRSPTGGDQESVRDAEVQNAGSLLKRMKLPGANIAAPKVPLRDRITESPEIAKDSLHDDDDEGQGDEANDGPSGSGSPFPTTTQSSSRRRGGGRRKGGRGSRRSRR